MPLIYLRHPRHGEKIATLELEAEYDEQNGWERYTVEAPEATPEVPVNHMVRRRRRESADVHHSG